MALAWTISFIIIYKNTAIVTFRVKEGTMLDNIGESEGEGGSIKVYNLDAGQHDPKWPNLEKEIIFCKQTADDVNKMVGKKCMIILIAIALRHAFHLVMSLILVLFNLIMAIIHIIKHELICP